MSGKPPVGRPGEPPLDEAPPAHIPHAPGSDCNQQSDMSYEAYWGAVRETIRREIIRQAVGSENVDKGYSLSPLGERFIEDLVSAFQEGHHVPGLANRVDQSGKCTMNWYELACFARWFTGRYVAGDNKEHSGEMRAYVLDQLRSGVTAKELMEDEIVGMNWYFCTGNEPEEEKDSCCPKYVHDDWYYKELGEGHVPDLSKPPSAGSSALTIALLGLGVFAVAMSIRVLAGASTPVPRASNPVSEVMAIPRRQVDRLQRQLREKIASARTFEEWDELREYVSMPGRKGSVPTWVYDAMLDLQGLVLDLRDAGVKTNEARELDWMLDLSAGA